MSQTEYVSVHGGHSGQFCNHAEDLLEDIIKVYIDKGFSWLGVTEHAPAYKEELLYTDQRVAGLTPAFLFDRFGLYIEECRRLQRKYQTKITIFAAMEIETYSGYDSFVPYLIDSFKPDYIVGSVHFVNDMNFDYSAKMYRKAAEAAGGIDRLYEHYFDLQYEMIQLLKPAVVGHFDLIRIFDPEYRQRLVKPRIWSRIERNLELIKEYGLILDYNLRALVKGADEPYITDSILRRVREMDVLLAPGDDSHGIANVGNYMDDGIRILKKHGFPTDWPVPRIIRDR
ncbi:MAG: histidinol phosphatase [Desulfobacterales bacterium]|nr:MAG: histidinol phosphatase [Desulfobacterales bacterium]